MLETSFLSGIFIMAYFERTHRKIIPFFHGLFFMGFLLLLSILSNYCRIITLVVFKIHPDQWMHDLTGILCMLTYTLLPFFLILKGYFSNVRLKEIHSAKGLAMPPYFLHLVLITGIYVVSSFPDSKHLAKENSSVDLKGFRKELLKGEIAKYERKNSLIYIKPGVKFYQSDHNPQICWQGSGYQFKSIKKKRLAGFIIYWACLQKEQDRLYTSWWFENGTDKTIDPIHWRLENLKTGKAFELVNITAGNEQDLFKLTESFLRGGFFHDPSLNE